MHDFLAAVGLVFVIEGLLYGGFPGLARRAAKQAALIPDPAMRAAGIAAIALGVLIVWAVRG